jgi:hypothetical protein
MSSQYRKIKYETEGSYGSTEEKWLYVWSHDTVDITHVFDNDGEFLFCYSETGFDMGHALAIIGTDWQNEKMEMMTREEIEKLRK